MKLDKIFKILSGRGEYTEAYLVTHYGEYPVLSGTTKHKGVFGFIDHYDYDLPQCLSYSKDGEHSGTIFLQDGKLSLTSHVNILLLREKYKDKVNLSWFKFKYEPIFKELVRGKFGIPSLPSDIVKKIEVTLPPLRKQSEELARFKTKESVIKDLNKAISEIDRKLLELRQIVIEVHGGIDFVGSTLLEPLPKNSGLTEKFLYDYSDPTYPEQIPVYNGASSPSGYLPSYALNEINKNLIINKKGDAILIVRKGVKAGTVFIPNEDNYIVGEDIVIVKFRDHYKDGIDSRWFIREFYKSFRLNTTGDEGSATFSLLKMNKMHFNIPSPTIQKKMVEKYEALDKITEDLLSLKSVLQSKVKAIYNLTLL